MSYQSTWPAHTLHAVGKDVSGKKAVPVAGSSTNTEGTFSTVLFYLSDMLFGELQTRVADLKLHVYNQILSNLVGGVVICSQFFIDGVILQCYGGRGIGKLRSSDFAHRPTLVRGFRGSRRA